MKRIAPSSASPPLEAGCGLCAVVPAGMTNAVSATVFANLESAGLNKISYPVLDLTSESSSSNLSLTLRILVVFKTPLVVKLPDDATTERFDPMFTLPEIDVDGDEIERLVDVIVPVVIPVVVILEEVNVVTVPVVDVSDDRDAEDPVMLPLLIPNSIESVDRIFDAVIANPDPKTFGLLLSVVSNPSSPSLPPMSGWKLQ